MLVRHAAILATKDCSHHRWGAVVAAAEFLDPSLDEEAEIDEAEAELDDISSNKGYWPKIKEKLLSLSSSSEATEAVREWIYTDMWVGDEGTCELCGFHPIKYHFKIVNQITRNSLVVGSECIYNYLEIPGVPSPVILKRRLNQLRARLKELAEGVDQSDANLRQFQEIGMLERILYQRIQVLAAPDTDFDADEAARSVSEVVQIYASLHFVPTGAFKTCQEASKQLSQLRRFIASVAKRAKKLEGFSAARTVEAIMRLRTDADKKANLSKMKGFLDDLGKLGNLTEVVSRGWDSLREAREVIVNGIEKEYQTASQQLRGRYEDELAFLRRYEYLHAALRSAVTHQRKVMSISAQAAIKFIQSDAFIENPQKGRQTAVFTPKTTLEESSDPLVLTGSSIVRIVDMVRGNRAKWAYDALIRKGYKLTQPDMLRIWLECLNAGVIKHWGMEPEKSIEMLITQFGSDAVQKIVRAIVPDAAPADMTVVEAMTQAWGLDAEEAFKRLDPKNAKESRMATDLLDKFLAGRTALTFNQASILKRKLNTKAVDPNMWEELKSKLQQRQDRSKLAKGYAR